jgi:molybdate transport system ATP-binding protein
MISIRLRKHISRVHTSFTLDVDYAIGPEQKRVVFFGPSGSGKSLTLLCLSGLVQPDSGQLRLGDKILYDDTAGVSVSARRRHIGYMFQDYALFPHLTVLQNAAYARTGCLPHLLGAEERARARSILHRLGIAELAEQKPDKLSGGQRQRVALARALNADPELLLLDEPFTALDTLLRERLRKELLEILAALRIPAIIISHDPEDVDAFADELVLYNNGRARLIRDYATIRADFATSGQCLRHLQENWE